MVGVERQKNGKRLFLFFHFFTFSSSLSVPLARALTLVMLRFPPEIANGAGAASATAAAAAAAEGAAATEAREATDEGNCFASPVLLFRGGGSGGRASTSSGSGGSGGDGGGVAAGMPASSAMAAARGGGKTQVRFVLVLVPVVGCGSFFFRSFTCKRFCLSSSLLSLPPRSSIPFPKTALVALGGVSESLQSSRRSLRA